MKVPFIDYKASDAAEISALLKPIEENPIAVFSWEEVPAKPNVYFKIAHNNQAILLQYGIRENEVVAKYHNINDPVYKDSCVEFFVSLTGGKDYYNLEFNSLGTCLGGYGHNRHNRKRLAENVLQQIKLQSVISRNSPDFTEWKLDIFIPITIFQHTPICSLEGIRAHANFYKCGDDLSSPHYLSWKKIDTPTPDFHQPSFFDEIEFCMS